MPQVKNTAFGSVVSQYDYVSDALGRRTEIARSGARMTESRSDVYGYNDRSELTNAVKNAVLNEYAYQYDDIGNRLSSIEAGTGNREREASPILRPLRPLQRNSLPSTTSTATRRLFAHRPAIGPSPTTARIARGAGGQTLAIRSM